MSNFMNIYVKKAGEAFQNIIGSSAEREKTPNKWPDKWH